MDEDFSYSRTNNDSLVGDIISSQMIGEYLTNEKREESSVDNTKSAFAPLLK